MTYKEAIKPKREVFALRYEELGHVQPRIVEQPTLSKERIEAIGIWVANFTLLGFAIAARFVR